MSLDPPEAEEQIRRLHQIDTRKDGILNHEKPKQTVKIDLTKNNEDNEDTNTKFWRHFTAEDQVDEVEEKKDKIIYIETMLFYRYQK